jgi:polysaccharide deacetylase 2 family uncharacterized protein YibQ
VILVAAFVVRGCLPKRAPAVAPVKQAVPANPVKKKARVPRKIAPVPAPSGGAELAIILDDWGNDHALLAEAIAVGRPLTLAVLPKLKHSVEIAREAHEAGLGVMLHMPMQSKGGRDAEPHTILTTSPDAEVLSYLEEGIAAVPFLEGVNNHQGSAATSDERVMRLVLGRIKKKGFFFVDSKVIASSVASDVAEELGLRHATRDVFLDNVAEVEAVKEQLRKAVAVALKHGRAVAIGHDKRVTLRAIREMLPELDAAGVRLVYARDLVR